MNEKQKDFTEAFSETFRQRGMDRAAVEAMHMTPGEWHVVKDSKDWESLFPVCNVSDEDGLWVGADTSASEMLNADTGEKWAEADAKAIAMLPTLKTHTLALHDKLDRVREHMAVTPMTKEERARQRSTDESIVIWADRRVREAMEPLQKRIDTLEYKLNNARGWVRHVKEKIEIWNESETMMGEDILMLAGSLATIASRISNEADVLLAEIQEEAE